MPWNTPSLRAVRETVRGEITASLGRASFVGNSVLRVLADATAALTHLTLRYIDWLALQLMPDTAEQIWLDRHGDIWLTNADNSTGRKLGAFAEGEVMVSGIQGTVLPAGARLVGSDAWSYEVTEQVFITPTGVTASVRSLEYGTGGNRAAGDVLSFEVAISGVDGQAPVVLIDGGVDPETDDQLRERVLRRIRQPPMGGAAHDYEAWALSVQGVTRAWCNPLEMGIGTVSVRFMMDEVRKDNDGFPTGGDALIVEQYLRTQRPVAVKDFFVVPPLRQRVDVVIEDLMPSTDAVKAAVEANLTEMLLRQAAPGQTIYAAWKAHAVMDALGVISFRMKVNTDDVMESPGHMAVLGDIIYAVSPL